MIIIIRRPAVAVCSVWRLKPWEGLWANMDPADQAKEGCPDPGCPPKLQLTLVINLLQLPQIIEQLLGYIVVKIGICLLFPTMSLSNCMLSDSEWCF